MRLLAFCALAFLIPLTGTAFSAGVEGSGRCPANVDPVCGHALGFDANYINAACAKADGASVVHTGRCNYDEWPKEAAQCGDRRLGDRTIKGPDPTLKWGRVCAVSGGRAQWYKTLCTAMADNALLTSKAECQSGPTSHGGGNGHRK